MYRNTAGFLLCHNRKETSLGQRGRCVIACLCAAECPGKGRILPWKRNTFSQWKSVPGNDDDDEDSVLSVFVAVVLDRKNDKSCDTGLFELIYRQPPITDPPQLDSNLCVEGRKVNCSSSVLP